MFGMIPTMVSPDSVLMALNPTAWMDARYAPAAASAAVPDRAGRANTFTPPSTGPTRTTASTGCQALAFASAATRLATPAIDLTGTAKIWVLCVDEMTASTFMVQADLGSGTTRAFLARWNNVANKNTSVVSTGNVGTSNIWTTGEYTALICGSYVVDWSLASGSEVELLVNNASVATNSGAAENTGNFGNQTLTVGSDNAGAGANFYQGNIAQFMLFSYYPTAAQKSAAYQALRQICAIT